MSRLFACQASPHIEYWISMRPLITIVLFIDGTPKSATGARFNICPGIPDRIRIWQCWFLWRGENRRKTPRSKERTNNKLNPQVTRGAALVGGERSHHCTTPVPSILRTLVSMQSINHIEAKGKRKKRNKSRRGHFLLDCCQVKVKRKRNRATR